MTMYTSSEINVALQGNQTVSVYDSHIYNAGNTPGNLWKKINVVEDAEDWTQTFNELFLLHENNSFPFFFLNKEK